MCGKGKSMCGEHKGRFEKVWTSSEPNISRNLRSQKGSVVKIIETGVGSSDWDSPTLPANIEVALS